VIGSKAGIVTSLNRSDGGVPKLPIETARVTIHGIEGDRQRNLKHHGGPDRALCLYSADIIDRLQSEGHPIFPGSIGENVTIRGLDWGLLKPGAAVSIGNVEVELTSFAVPCRNIRGSFRWSRSSRVSPKAHPGEARLYARIRREGVVTVGDPVHIR
jgi:MOSC domain-containing protein YiiM